MRLHRDVGLVKLRNKGKETGRIIKKKLSKALDLELKLLPI